MSIDPILTIFSWEVFFLLHRRVRYLYRLVYSRFTLCFLYTQYCCEVFWEWNHMIRIHLSPGDVVELVTKSLGDVVELVTSWLGDKLIFSSDIFDNWVHIKWILICDTETVAGKFDCKCQKCKWYKKFSDFSIKLNASPCLVYQSEKTLQESNVLREAAAEKSNWRIGKLKTAPVSFSSCRSFACATWLEEKKEGVSVEFRAKFQQIPNQLLFFFLVQMHCRKT